MGGKYNIAVIPGDGVGPEIIKECKKVLKCVSDINGIVFHTKDFPGATVYLQNGRMLEKMPIQY